jgi:hypothetical protein
LRGVERIDHEENELNIEQKLYDDITLEFKQTNKEIFDFQ